MECQQCSSDQMQRSIKNGYALWPSCSGGWGDTKRVPTAVVLRAPASSTKQRNSDMPSGVLFDSRGGRGLHHRARSGPTVDASRLEPGQRLPQARPRRCGPRRPFTDAANPSRLCPGLRARRPSNRPIPRHGCRQICLSRRGGPDIVSGLLADRRRRLASSRETYRSQGMVELKVISWVAHRSYLERIRRCLDW